MPGAAKNGQGNEDLGSASQAAIPASRKNMTARAKAIAIKPFCVRLRYTDAITV
jgi:hypothetical protein